VGEGEASAVARCGASQGYVAYEYRHRPDPGDMAPDLTRSGSVFRCRLLLPEGKEAREVVCRGDGVEFTASQLGERRYVDFAMEGAGSGPVTVRYG
jgi:hypothetical protein